MQAIATAELPSRISHDKVLVVFGGLLLVMLLAALDSTIVATALPTIVKELGGLEHIGLIIIAVVALVAFLIVEQRAAEPILPLHLFRIRDVWVTSAVGLIIGFALLGSVTYLPLFLQIVKGLSPTASGLRMVPLMGGTLVTSILAGQIVSRTGRYKIFPIVGTTLVTLSLFLISRMTMETSIFTASLYMLLLGLGLGFVMQVLIIAVQNVVDYHDLGVATSNAILFRFIGGSLGTSLLGAVLATQLNKNITPESVATSLHTVFLVATVVASLGLLLSLLLPERPLRQTIAAATEADIGGDMGQAFAMPTGIDSREHLLRGLAVLADRDVLRRSIAAVVERAGVELTIGAAWLLVQIEREPGASVQQLGRNAKVEASIVEHSTTELLNNSLIEQRSGNDIYALTKDGCAIYNRLAAARREHLAELWPEWSPKKREDVAAILRRLARELVPEANR